MKNREIFEKTYNEIHAPEALVWKVKDMTRKKERAKAFKTRNVIKYAVSTLAIMVLAFAASNGICYSATGESLITKIKVTINGEETEQDIEWSQEGDSHIGTITIPGENGSVSTIMLQEDATDDFDVEIYMETEESMGEEGVVEEESITMEIRDNEDGNSVSVENETQAGEQTDENQEEITEETEEK